MSTRHRSVAIIRPTTRAADVREDVSSSSEAVVPMNEELSTPKVEESTLSNHTNMDVAPDDSSTNFVKNRTRSNARISLRQGNDSIKRKASIIIKNEDTKLDYSSSLYGSMFTPVKKPILNKVEEKKLLLQKLEDMLEKGCTLQEWNNSVLKQSIISKSELETMRKEKGEAIILELITIVEEGMRTKNRDMLHSVLQKKQTLSDVYIIETSLEEQFQTQYYDAEAYIEAKLLSEQLAQTTPPPTPSEEAVENILVSESEIQDTILEVNHSSIIEEHLESSVFATEEDTISIKDFSSRGVIQPNPSENFTGNTKEEVVNDTIEDNTTEDDDTTTEESSSSASVILNEETQIITNSMLDSMNVVDDVVQKSPPGKSGFENTPIENLNVADIDAHHSDGEYGRDLAVDLQGDPPQDDFDSTTEDETSSSESEEITEPQFNVISNVEEEEERIEIINAEGEPSRTNEEENLKVSNEQNITEFSDSNFQQKANTAESIDLNYKSVEHETIEEDKSESDILISETEIGTPSKYSALEAEGLVEKDENDDIASVENFAQGENDTKSTINANLSKSVEDFSINTVVESKPFIDRLQTSTLHATSTDLQESEDISVEEVQDIIESTPEDLSVKHSLQKILEDDMLEINEEETQPEITSVKSVVYSTSTATSLVESDAENFSDVEEGEDDAIVHSIINTVEQEPPITLHEVESIQTIYDPPNMVDKSAEDENPELAEINQENRMNVQISESIDLEQTVQTKQESHEYEEVLNIQKENQLEGDVKNLADIIKAYKNAASTATTESGTENFSDVEDDNMNMQEVINAQELYAEKFEEHLSIEPVEASEMKDLQVSENQSALHDGVQQDYTHDLQTIDVLQENSNTEAKYEAEVQIVDINEDLRKEEVALRILQESEENSSNAANTDTAKSETSSIQGEIVEDAVDQDSTLNQDVEQKSHAVEPSINENASTPLIANMSLESTSDTPAFDCESIKIEHSEPGYEEIQEASNEGVDEFIISESKESFGSLDVQELPPINQNADQLNEEQYIPELIEDVISVDGLHNSSSVNLNILEDKNTFIESQPSEAIDEVLILPKIVKIEETFNNPVEICKLFSDSILRRDVKELESLIQKYSNIEEASISLHVSEAKLLLEKLQKVNQIKDKLNQSFTTIITALHEAENQHIEGEAEVKNVLQTAVEKLSRIERDKRLSLRIQQALESRDHYELSEVVSLASISLEEEYNPILDNLYQRAFKLYNIQCNALENFDSSVLYEPWEQFLEFKSSSSVILSAKMMVEKEKAWRLHKKKEIKKRLDRELIELNDIGMKEVVDYYKNSVLSSDSDPLHNELDMEIELQIEKANSLCSKAERLRVDLEDAIQKEDVFAILSILKEQNFASINTEHASLTVEKIIKQNEERTKKLTHEYEQKVKEMKASKENCKCILQ